MLNILDKTVDLLRRTDTPLHQIATDTGLSVRFLYYLRDGTYTDPSVTRIQRLHDYLVGGEDQ